MPDDLTLALKELSARSGGYRRYAAYYDGDHPLAFATPKFESAFGGLFRAFADNLCPAVVDAVGDRLTLVGFGTETGAETLTEAAWQVWQDNRMDERAAQVHSEALCSGDAYLIVWPDEDGQPRLHPNAAAQMVAWRDEERPERLTRAAKVWKRDEDGFLRANVYYPDRIEKFVTRNKPSGIPESSRAFERYEEVGETWPLRNPYGQVPVFHFANNPRLDRRGRSELADVVPLQDALNKSVADMLVAAEYVAFPQRWAVGLEVDVDPVTGKVIPPFSPGADRVWAVGDKEVTFGQFDPAGLEQYLKEQDSLRLEIARVSRTPLHYVAPMTGEFPSGEALRTAEAPFLAKAKRKQVSFGNVWENALEFALLIQGAAGQVKLSALWEDPTPRGEKESAEAITLKRGLGVSEEQGLRELGYSDAQIEDMTTAKETEIRRAQLLMTEDVIDGVTQ